MLRFPSACAALLVLAAAASTAIDVPPNVPSSRRFLQSQKVCADV